MSTDRRRARRIGVMGGTFDPIHNGHLVAASEVAHRFELDEVIFVPTGRPWQKLGEHAMVSPPEDRYLMTVIATASNPQFSVSRVDIDREGDTYTVDTLRDLHKQLPDAQLYFITGADALESILSWQDWEELFDLARFVGVSRPGYKLDATHLAKHLEQLPADTLTLLEIPALSISSTECRARAAQGRPVWYLVPDGVVQYIAKRKLYRAPRASSPGVSAPGAERAGGGGAAPGAERAGGGGAAPGAERAGGGGAAPGAERAGGADTVPQTESIERATTRK
ncbi:nicotinate-nicotinamide nucleotide adenylyltransferase [Gordonia paraffinivorans]|uniref:nicotinate-nucleotide adenylyltransferase n=2 Tax=Gordonia paraffinivorans TaxID=175628 RepID=UPI000D60BC28|nr:nicotinate-nucleotide adenylyltransferase [Gordonia paraffinivorans]PWD44382.1 nicotinate-nicotinamide nucleotide adenylyltransferase [Gordonia paraffinivorans]